MIHVAAGRRRPTSKYPTVELVPSAWPSWWDLSSLPPPPLWRLLAATPAVYRLSTASGLSYCVLRLKEIPAPRSFMPSKQRLPSSLLPTTERQRTALLHGLLWIVTVSAVSFLLGDAPVEAISYGAFSGILYGIVVYVWQPY